MLSSFVHLFSPRPSPEGRHRFVEEVRVDTLAPARSRRVERVLLACWILIAAKCWLVVWLVDKYHMKFDALWVTAPTVLFALLCTAVYYFHE